MKRLMMLTVGVLMVVFLSSCATRLERRIARYPQTWQQLPVEEKMLAERAQIREGMSRDGVFFSWGPPHGVAEGSSGGKRLEQWKYFSYVPVTTYRQTIGFGRGYGYCPHGYGYYDFGPETYYVPRDAAEVDFQNGRVTAYRRQY